MSYQRLVNNTRLDIFIYLRDALWHQKEAISSSLSGQQAYYLLQEAEKQAVSGLVIDALIRNDVRIPQEILFNSIGLQEQIKQSSLKLNEGVKSLHQIFSNNNVSYVVVKGQVVASYYPDPLIRQSGDVDYYCNNDNFPKSLKVVKDSWNINPDIEESSIHIHFEKDSVTYEGHYSLALLYNKKKNAYWQKILDEDMGATVDIGGVKVVTLSPTIHALYIFLHLYRHLMELGVGLRQFCDWAIILHYCKDCIDHHKLQQHLKVLGLEMAYRACGSILVDYLGLPQKDFGYTITDKDRSYGTKVLDVVLYRGNMGHFNKRHGYVGWKHKLEVMGIKVSHFVKFMPIAPGFSCNWLWYGMCKKVLGV